MSRTRMIRGKTTRSPTWYLMCGNSLQHLADNKEVLVRGITTLSPKSSFYRNMFAVCGQVNACVPLISCVLAQLFRTAQRTEKDTSRELSYCLLLCQAGHYGHKLLEGTLVLLWPSNRWWISLIRLIKEIHHLLEGHGNTKVIWHGDGLWSGANFYGWCSAHIRLGIDLFAAKVVCGFASWEGRDLVALAYLATFEVDCMKNSGVEGSLHDGWRVSRFLVV